MSDNYLSSLMALAAVSVIYGVLWIVADCPWPWRKR